jgi:aminoacylase
MKEEKKMDFEHTSELVSLSEEEKKRAVEAFSSFIQFETVSNTAPTTGEYKRAAEFLTNELRSIPCLDEIHYLEEAPEHSPVVVARWKGVEEDLPVILLNSHYDVVPAVREDWTVEPFQGLIKDGKIYGRGTQDMKCVCIQYIEAIRKLATTNFQPARSIYLTFVPDEEVGGGGMAALLSSKLYKNLPGIALALDEGLASENDTYSVFYGERLPWWVDVTAKGNTGHGSRFIEHTAVEQIIEVANRALAFREGQKAALHGTALSAKHENCAHAVAAKKMRLIKDSNGSKMALGDVTSLNITTLRAGVLSGNEYVRNVVPPLAKCSLDIRISPHVHPSKIKDMLDQWCQECSSSKEDGHVLTWDYIGDGNNQQEHAVTSTDGKVNPWYNVFGSSLQRMGLKFSPEVFPAATDSRFLRALGVRALGFSPMRNSEILLHENDEYLEEKVFLEGISVYVGLIETLASQGREIDDQIL